MTMPFEVRAAGSNYPVIRTREAPATLNSEELRVPGIEGHRSNEYDQMSLAIPRGR